jgi:aminoglycoside phosphotransferase (APT) family kinase protein
VRMHADQIDLTVDVVAHLVAGQFPRWAGRPVRPVASDGTVNALFRLGDDIVLRFPLLPAPRAELLHEQENARRIAPHVPLEVPEPLALGEPGAGYPGPWAVYRWIPGTPATVTLGDPDLFARDLAGFVRALHGLDTGGRTWAGHGRGRPLQTQDSSVRSALADSTHLTDTGRLARIWESCLAAAAGAEGSSWISGNRAGATSGSQAAGVTSSNQAAGATSSNRAPGATSGNQAPGVTSGNQAPGVASGNQAPGATSSNQAPGPTSSNQAEGATSSNQAQGATSSNQATGATSGNQAPGATSVTPAWVHADLMPGNLLVRDGRLAAVIDLGTLTVGDPALDLMPAWNLLPPRPRETYRNSLGADDAMWARGVGWALMQAIVALPYYVETNPGMARTARHTLDAILAAL